MTTYVDFAPAPKQPFQFQPTLDGRTYKVQCRWNLHGQRWYVFLYDLSQNLICCVAMVGSPDAALTTAVAWDGARQVVTVTCAAPHGLRLGSLADLTLTGVSPTAYNGRWRFAVTSPVALEYAQPVDPGGPATSQGAVGADLDLVRGYFKSSTLVYRTSSKQFEISP